MDRHAMMWNEATRDIDDERAERALAYALADLSGVRDFTHAAASRTEYDHRIALAADTITVAAATHHADAAAVTHALEASFGHVLAARTAAVARAAKTAAAAPPQAPPAPPQQPSAPTPPADVPGAPADILTGDATAKTSKPRTLPAGAPPAPAPMPAMPAGPSAGGAPAPGAQAAPAVHTASRRQIIEADIAALNPHLPPATITRLATAAMRHLAAAARHTASEPLAYGNWENPEDGPITRSVKNWQPGGSTGGHGQEGGTGGEGPSGTPDPAGPAAADVAEEALPLLAAAART